MKKILSLVFISFFVTGCGYNSNPNMSGLKKEVNKIENQDSSVNPINIPKLNKDEHYVYKNADKKSPFGIEKHIVKNTIFPDLKRKKDKLEKYDLSQLKFQGALAIKNGPWQAMIVTNDGHVLTTERGHYMGKHYGKIISVTNKKIKIRELYKNKEGVWYKSYKILTKK